MASVSTAIQTRPEALTPLQQRPSRLPSLPWRDPHSVPPEQLAEFIRSLKLACAGNPDSADLRTCLGIAYAMNYDPQRSMDALEDARRVEPGNYFAQLKYAELLFRLRIIDRAESETKRALDLAGNNWELSAARRQLSEIRQLRRKGLTRPDWSKSSRSVNPVPGGADTHVCALGFSPQSFAVPVAAFVLLLLGATWIYIVWK